MLQRIIVLLVLAVTLFFAVRWLLRTVKGKGGCNCHCSDCPYRNKDCRHS